MSTEALGVFVLVGTTIMAGGALVAAIHLLDRVDRLERRIERMERRGRELEDES